MKHIILILSILLTSTHPVFAGDKFVVAPFSSDVDEWITNNFRSTFINKLNDDGNTGTGMESLGSLPATESGLLSVLNARGYKYLIRGKLLATHVSAKDIKVYSIEAKGTVEKRVYTASVSVALSYINTKTGCVDFSLADSRTSKEKDSEEEAIKDASSVIWAGTFLPREYTQKKGRITKIGDTKKDKAKTVFAVLENGSVYKGWKYDVYEQFQSEEIGLPPGETLTRQVGELKLKQDGKLGQTLEMKVDKGEEAIKRILDAGQHQLIIK